MAIVVGHGKSALLAGALTALVALAGCAPADAGNAQGAEATTSVDGLLPEAEGTTQYPLTLETPYGSTELAERPERIAVVGGLGDLESTVALGVAPVTSPWDFAELAWLDEYAEAGSQAAVINVWAEEFPYETIAAAEPDLIVALTLGTLGDQFERLAEIAPVLGGDGTTEFDGSSTDWRAITRSIGTALDLADRAEGVITETEEHIAVVAERNPAFEGRTIGLLINRGEEYGVELLNLDGTTTEELLSNLGFAPHPNATAVTEALSLENIGLVDADLLLVHQHGGTGEPAVAQAWLEASPLYQRLDAVQRGAVALTVADAEDSRSWNLPWALSWPDPLNLRYTTDTLETALAGIVDQ